MHLGSFTVPLVAALFASISSGQTAILTYVNLESSGAACCIVPDGRGNTFVVSSAGGPVSVTKLDADQNVASVFHINRPAQANAAALDPQGNLWIAGSIYVPVGLPALSYTAGFLAKVDPTGTRLLLSAPIGGTDPYGVTIAHAVALDTQSNVYIAGQTTQKDFPVTPGSFQGFGTVSAGDKAFVMKVSSGGDLRYSTLLGGKQAVCVSGTACRASSIATAIGVDSNGIATVAGTTDATDFPVTEGALQRDCKCLVGAGNAFVTRLNTTGAGLAWSTFLGGSPALPSAPNVQSLALDEAGNVIVVGHTDSGYVAKLNSTGTALIFSEYFGGFARGSRSTVRFDREGNVWVTASEVKSDRFPMLPNSLLLGSALIAKLAPNGDLLFSDFLPNGALGRDLAVDFDGSIVTLSSAGSMLRLPPRALQGPSIFGVADSAATGVAGRVAPGEFVSVYGRGLGPEPGVGALIDSAGTIVQDLEGTKVYFDGRIAPLLYASENQINVLVPYGVTAREKTTMQIVTAGGLSQNLSLFVVPAQPNVLAVLNEDGTVNSPGNPAARGSSVVLYVSGAGMLDQDLPDGSVAPSPAPKPVLPVTVTIWAPCPGSSLIPCSYRTSIEPDYAASIPGSVVNLLRVSLKLPSYFSEVEIKVGNYATPSFGIYVK